MDWPSLLAIVLTVAGTNALTWACARIYAWARARRYYADELEQRDNTLVSVCCENQRLRAQRDEARARVYEHIDGLSAEYVGSEGEG